MTIRATRSFAALGAAGLVMLAAALAPAAAASEDEPAVTDIVLTVGADETQRNLAWYTPAQASVEVQWAPASAVDGDDFSESTANRAEPEDSGETHDGRQYYHATMDGLEPSAEYVYRVGGEDGWSATYEFATGDADAQATEFLVVGDPQLGSSGDVEADRGGWQSTLDTAAQMFPDVAWVQSMGDQVEEPSNESQYRALLDPGMLRSVPFAFNLGNHDADSSAFSTHFFMPGAGDSMGYHWYRHGDVLVIGLDSNTLDVEAHEAFIERVLTEHGDEAAWHVVTFHHTAFGVARHSNEAALVEYRNAIAPVLSEHGIDLVLMGHDHTYARTHLMDGREPVPSDDPGDLHPQEGEVLYLTVNSASGSKYYPLLEEDDLEAADPEGFDYAQVTWQEEAPSFTHVAVEGDAMSIATYRTDTGEAYDELVLHRAGATETSASPSPSASASPSEETPSPTASPSADARDETDAEGGLPPVAVTALVAGVLALGVGGVALWRRGRD